MHFMISGTRQTKKQEQSKEINIHHYKSQEFDALGTLQTIDALLYIIHFSSLSGIYKYVVNVLRMVKLTSL